MHGHCVKEGLTGGQTSVYDRVILRMQHKHWLIVLRDPERCVRQTLLHQKNEPQGGTSQGTSYCRALRDYSILGSQRRHPLWCKPPPGTEGLRSKLPSSTNAGFLSPGHSVRLSQDNLRGSAQCWENEEAPARRRPNLLQAISGTALMASHGLPLQFLSKVL